MHQCSVGGHLDIPIRCANSRPTDWLLNCRKLNQILQVDLFFNVLGLCSANFADYNDIDDFVVVVDNTICKESLGVLCCLHGCSPIFYKIRKTSIRTDLGTCNTRRFTINMDRTCNLSFNIRFQNSNCCVFLYVWRIRLQCTRKNFETHGRQEKAMILILNFDEKIIKFGFV